MDYSFNISGQGNERLKESLMCFKPAPIDTVQDVVDLFKSCNLDLNKAFLTDRKTGIKKSIAELDQELNN